MRLATIKNYSIDDIAGMHLLLFVRARVQMKLVDLVVISF